MQITPINISYTKPRFGAEQQNKTNRKYNTSPMSLPYANNIDDNVFSVDSSFLPQRYNISTAHTYDANKTFDSFTGLRDKNYLLSSLNIAMQNAQINDKPLSIAMFDMDNFKSVNELLGYETGDIFIKEISKDIASICQEKQVEVYRFGGEEFVMIFNGETEEQKKEIAVEISQKANSNPKIQSYKSLYLRNAATRLNKAIYSTLKVHKLAELKTKKATIEQVLENLTSKEAQNDPYFGKIMEELSLDINKRYIALINECLANDSNEKNRYILGTAKSKLTSGIELLETEEQVLDDYLNSVYDKSNEIYQTKKWLSDFNNNNGFGITGGVVNFEPSSFEYKTPMDIIGKTGNILKNGKNKGKGRVYFETVSY